ncbi:MAG: glutamine synthetase III [Clostridia bacterium]|nr:glutamine synthetase III [Clostridia bacterium]
MNSAAERFGSDVFNDRAMKAVLPKDVYTKLIATISEGRELDATIADQVASAMKNWAVSKGATNYTHWFQPMTGVTAEKHDGFLAPCEDGSAIMDFSGKELIKGEPDASSFPSGGLRSTFEARGYTAWDPTSYAFIKGKTLCIPTAFCAYSGEALDQKTPLLRSMDALNTQALRVLRLLGDTESKRVRSMAGAEQEYFLVDKTLYEKRPDLIYTGRTLFGNPAPKGQELDDHYFGAIRPRVRAFMEELNECLWRLGIPAKTEHNEVAPAQHELAPIYENCNVAADHNQLTMELMRTIAEKHGLVCLLHEKPFANVNGSGKHNNWSIGTDTGVNLLKPGKTPETARRFMLFLTAVLKAVDDYQDLLRISVATAGNDHRLGGNEAPPAVLSIFLGDELEAMLDDAEKGLSTHASKKSVMQLGVEALPAFKRDATDRNRTSPFAFTGNKFEFRMPGSSLSIAGPNTVLNSIVADTLRIFADELEAAEDLDGAITALIMREVKAHRRIAFNGNGYDDAWVKEATEKRGLLELKTTPDCLPLLVAEKNIAMFNRMKVFSETELVSRYRAKLEIYTKTVRIEARTMLSMARTEILPAIESAIAATVKEAKTKQAVFPEITCGYERKFAGKMSALLDAIDEAADALESAVASAEGLSEEEEAFRYRDVIIPAMDALRAKCDEAEAFMPESKTPFPTYGALLFSV